MIDEEIIYSKKDLIACDNERFPYENEITSLIKAYKRI